MYGDILDFMMNLYTQITVGVFFLIHFSLIYYKF